MGIGCRAWAATIAISLTGCSESATGPGGGNGDTSGDPDSLVQLTDDQYDRNHPCWSPDGSQIWYTRYEVTQPDNVLTSNIWSMPSAGGVEMRRTSYAGVTDFPSSKPGLLAFRSDHDGHFDIYTSSGSVVNITNTDAKDFEVACTPADASGILALSKADSLHGGVVWNIYMLDSGGLAQVTTGNKDFHPTFSRTGQLIAFQRTHSEVHGAQILVISRYGGAEVEVTPFGDSCHHPDWNRAYDKIAFCRGGDVYMRDPDGSNETQLTFVTQFAQYPAWSPDGNRLAYVDLIGGRYTIFVKDVRAALVAP